MSKRTRDDIQRVGGFSDEVEITADQIKVDAEADDVAFVFDRLQLDLLLLDHVGRVQKN